MRSVASTLRGSLPMVLAIAAALCAAGLVLYYQHRALATLDAQTTVILRQIAEQTARDIAVEARRALDGPVFETLTAVNHPELRAGRLDLVAKEFADGLDAFPHVERFFVWSAQTERAAPGEALFLSREPGEEGPDREGPTAAFQRSPALGRAVVALANAHAPSQHIYVAGENIGPDRRTAFLRLFWTDALRVEYFAILGFVVEPSTVAPRLFASLHEGQVGALLRQRGSDVPLHLRVIDQSGAPVYGAPPPAAARATAAAPISMAPYSVERIESRLTNKLPARELQVEVSALPGPGVSGAGGYWPTALSAALIVVAMGLTWMANRRAAELARMQADFVSHVSHQLKTPLSLLSTATETLAMDRARSPEKHAQYLAIIRGEVTRLSALVQRILEFSRLQQPRGYEFEPVDLSALVRETVAAFEQGLSDQQFEFRVEAPAEPVMTVADPAAIEQALVNLLDNAVKYSAADRRIDVRVRAGGGAATVEVIDRGIGVDKPDRSRIFEKFYRGSGADLHRGGFGLGLPIALELVRAHRGRIEVDSVRGQGSTFRIVLPHDGPDGFAPAAAAAAAARPPEVRP